MKKMKNRFLKISILTILSLGTSLTVLSCSKHNDSKNDDIIIDNDNTNQDNNNDNKGDDNKNHDNNDGKGDGNTNKDNDYKKPFNERFLDLTKYTVNVTNATSLSISKNNQLGNNKSNLYRENNFSSTTSNTLVKTEYEPNGEEIENNTISSVKFNKIVTTSITSKVEGKQDYFATTDSKKEVNILEVQEPENQTEGKTNIKIECVEGYEYGLFKDDKLAEPWNKFDKGEHVFEVDSTENISIKCRSLNASISIKTTKGFEYTVKHNNEILDSFIAENNEIKIIDHLVEGEIYTVAYNGIGEETFVEQSELDGEIDKLYVYNDFYTFVSYVPRGTSNRPTINKDNVGEDGILTYDRTGYYCDKDRLSYVFDNRTGYIYKLDKIDIESIKFGIISLKNNNLKYQIFVDKEYNLVISPLFKNTSIRVFDYFTDKYGNKYIANDKLDYFDEATNTMFWISNKYHSLNCDGCPRYNSNFRPYYFLGKNNKAYLLENDKTNLEESGNISFSVIGEHFKKTPVTTYENTEIYCRDSQIYNNDYRSSKINCYKIEKGDAYFLCDQLTSEMKGYKRAECINAIEFFAFENKGIFKGVVDDMGGTGTYYGFVEDYDILLGSTSEGIYSVNNFSSHLGDTLTKTFFENYGELILDNVIVEDHKQVVRYGVDGNEIYDFYVEKIGGKYEVKPYLVGSFVPPEETTEFIFQPINRY